MSTKKKPQRRAAQRVTPEIDGEGMEYITGLVKVVDKHAVNMNEVCRRSKVARSLWTRWKKEAPGTLVILSRLTRNAEALIEEKKQRVKAVASR